MASRAKWTEESTKLFLEQLRIARAAVPRYVHHASRDVGGGPDCNGSPGIYLFGRAAEGPAKQHGGRFPEIKKESCYIGGREGTTPGTDDPYKYFLCRSR